MGLVGFFSGMLSPSSHPAFRGSLLYYLFFISLIARKEKDFRVITVKHHILSACNNRTDPVEIVAGSSPVFP
jgi:hypothetical protein